MKHFQNGNNVGIALAILGALLLTPDTLLMRISELDGVTMLVWRGGLSGIAYILIWVWFSLRAERKMPIIWTSSFAIIVLSQAINASFFSLAIAIAPVAVVLMAVATVPIFAVVLSRIILGEALSKFSIIVALLVLLGLSISVLGTDSTAPKLDGPTLLGAGLGLGVACSLALNFTIIRKDGSVPFVLAIGVGAFLAAGLGAFFVQGPFLPPLENLTAIAITGMIILPVSFVTLSYAARFAPSSTVSLIMLLETVLGQWGVWWGLGEAPTENMILGGNIVILCLVGFLINQGRVNTRIDN
jgi:drug/metabolite transporter (DMT)-like permease